MRGFLINLFVLTDEHFKDIVSPGFRWGKSYPLILAFNSYTLRYRLTRFKLNAEKEELSSVVQAIESGVNFRGTNLWVLIFAILLASLGLNVNSTAVIIGAMLISPLMGPIMGIGLGIGISDLALLRRAIYNYILATFVALLTSTTFFLLSPLDNAHSEILSRTSPNIYDVLIALFGGFAGIVATSSKLKGNVIPGVAIATALMPPLCTAGYGLATFQLPFFFGAFYLYIINTVFIALATFIIVRLLHIPYKHLENLRAEKLARRIVWVVVVATLLPSLYFGYDMVEQNKFTNNANSFITKEAHFTDDYLLSKKIDAKDKKIILVFGGKKITTEEIESLRAKLEMYDLQSANLEIKQGFAYLTETSDTDREQLAQLTLALNSKEKEEEDRMRRYDSVNNQLVLGKQLYAELNAQYPVLQSAILQPSSLLSDSSRSKQLFLVYLSTSRRLSYADRLKIEKWMKVRLNGREVKVIFQ